MAFGRMWRGLRALQCTPQLSQWPSTHTQSNVPHEWDRVASIPTDTQRINGLIGFINIYPLSCVFYMRIRFGSYGRHRPYNNILRHGFSARCASLIWIVANECYWTRCGLFCRTCTPARSIYKWRTTYIDDRIARPLGKKKYIYVIDASLCHVDITCNNTTYHSFILCDLYMLLVAVCCRCCLLHSRAVVVQYEYYYGMWHGIQYAIVV